MNPVPDVVGDFDRIADAIEADPRPDVLTPPERFLLRHVPASARRALDVGCGDGSLSRSLAARGIETLGIDASPRMIHLARRRAGDSPLLDYRVSDITIESPPHPGFDVVVSVAMAHHVPLERAVAYMRAAVAPGGILLLQDLTARPGLRNFPLNALAWSVRRLRSIRGGETRRATLEGLYEAHGAREKYLEPSEIARAYRTLLPGGRIYHHLEWRYTVLWRPLR